MRKDERGNTFQSSNGSDWKFDKLELWGLQEREEENEMQPR